MAAYGLDLLQETLGTLEGCRVLILGLSYRENVREAAFTTAARLIDGLRAAGATALLHDPLYTDDEVRSFGATPVALEPRPAADAVIVHAAHDTFAGLSYTSFPGVRVVLDGRGGLSDAQCAALDAAGIRRLRVGNAGL